MLPVPARSGRTRRSRTVSARRPPGSCRWRAAGGAGPTRRSGCRSPPRWRAGRRHRRRRRRLRRARSPVDRHVSVYRPAARSSRRVELLVVAVLGRPEEPVGRTERPGEQEAAGDVLAPEGPRRLHDEDLVVADAEGRRGWPAVTHGRVRVEGVVERDRLDPACRQLEAGALVDGDVPPGRVVRRGWHRP